MVTHVHLVLLFAFPHVFENIYSCQVLAFTLIETMPQFATAKHRKLELPGKTPISTKIKLYLKVI